MLWVRIPPEPLKRKLCPRGAAWSARLPVTLEIVGSNPIGDASIARYANRKSGEAQTFVTLWVRLPPVLLIGLCSSWLPVKQLSQNKRGGRREVQFLHDPLTNRPVRLTAGCEPLNLAMRVRFPHGSLTTAKWWNWETRDAQNVVPFAAWEFESPLGY